MKMRRNRLLSLLLAASMLTTSVLPGAGTIAAYAESETVDAAPQELGEAEEGGEDAAPAAPEAEAPAAEPVAEPVAEPTADPAPVEGPVTEPTPVEEPAAAPAEETPAAPVEEPTVPAEEEPAAEEPDAENPNETSEEEAPDENGAEANEEEVNPEDDGVEANEEEAAPDADGEGEENPEEDVEEENAEEDEEKEEEAAESKTYDLNGAYSSWVSGTDVQIRQVDGTYKNITDDDTVIPDSASFKIALSFQVPTTEQENFQGMQPGDKVTYAVPSWVRALDAQSGNLTVPGYGDVGTWKIEQDASGNKFFAISYSDAFLTSNHYGFSTTLNFQGTLDATYDDTASQFTIDFPGGISYTKQLVAGTRIANIDIQKALTNKIEPSGTNNNYYADYKITVFAGKYDEDGSIIHNTVDLKDLVVTDQFTTYEKGAVLNEAEYFENDNLLTYISYLTDSITYEIIDGFGHSVSTGTADRTLTKGAGTNGKDTFSLPILKPDEKLIIHYRVQISEEMYQHAPRGKENASYNSELPYSGASDNAVKTSNNSNRSWIDRMARNAASVTNNTIHEEDGSPAVEYANKTVNEMNPEQSSDLTFIKTWLWKNGSHLDANDNPVGPYRSMYTVKINEGDYQNVSGYTFTDNLNVTDNAQKLDGDITVANLTTGVTETLTLAEVEAGSISENFSGTGLQNITYKLPTTGEYKITFTTIRTDLSGNGEFRCANGAVLTENGGDRDTYGVYEEHTVKGATVTKRFISKDIAENTVTWQTTIDAGINVDNGSVYYDFVGWTENGTSSTAKAEDQKSHSIDMENLQLTITSGEDDEEILLVEDEDYTVRRLTLDEVGAKKDNKDDGFAVTFLKKFAGPVILRYTSVADFATTETRRTFDNDFEYRPYGPDNDEKFIDWASTAFSVDGSIKETVQYITAEETDSSDIKWFIEANRDKSELSQSIVSNTFMAGLTFDLFKDFTIEYVGGPADEVLTKDYSAGLQQETLADGTQRSFNEYFDITYDPSSQELRIKQLKAYKTTFRYSANTHLTADELKAIQESGEPKQYDNTSHLLTISGREISKSSAAATRFFELIEKGDPKYDTSTAPYAHYTIDINNGAGDLNPAGDTVTLTDNGMAAFMYFQTSTLKVYEGNSTNLLAANLYTMVPDTDQHGFTLTVPDGKHLRIEYDVLVQGKVGASVILPNNATITAFGEKYTVERTTTETVVAASRTAIQNQINIQKYTELKDTDGNITGTKTLSGAQFKVFYKDAALQFNGSDYVLTSGGDGIASNKTVDGQYPITFETTVPGGEAYVYTIKETKAPDGYVTPEGADAVVGSFVFLSTNSSIEEMNALQAQVGSKVNVILESNADFTYSFKNKPEDLPLTMDIPFYKKWEDGHENVGNRGNLYVSLYKRVGENGEEEFVEAKRIWYTDKSSEGKWWGGIFTDLPVYDENNQLITYILKEGTPLKTVQENPDGSKQEVSQESEFTKYAAGVQEGFVYLPERSLTEITYDSEGENKESFTVDPVTSKVTYLGEELHLYNQFQTYLTVNKAWNDETGNKPEVVKYQLRRRHNELITPIDSTNKRAHSEPLKDQEWENVGSVVEVPVNANSDGSYTFANLPKFEVVIDDMDVEVPETYQYYSWEYDAVEIISENDQYLPSYSYGDKTVNIRNTRLTRSLSGYLWSDTNRDGLQTADETPIIGQKVELYKLTPETQEYVATGKTADTDEKGEYKFTDLEPGTYQVRVVRDAVLTDKTGEEGTQEEGKSKAEQKVEGEDKLYAVISEIVMPTNEELRDLAEKSADENDENYDPNRNLFNTETGEYHMPHQDAGFITYNRSITGKAWFDNGKDDKNHDGSLDEDNQDEGIEGVIVKLLVKDEAGEYVPVKDAEGNDRTTTTDENGDYAFENLPEGTYKVVFENPANQGLTAKEAEGVESAKNSKADQVTEDGKIRGEIEEIKLPSDREIKKLAEDPTSQTDAEFNKENGTFTRTNQNAGYVNYSRSYEGIAWLDQDRDGIRGEDDEILAGVTVHLYEKNAEGEYVPVKDADGKEITAVTDEKGAYRFENLTGGVTYRSVFDVNKVVTKKAEDTKNDGRDSKADQTENGEELGAVVSEIYMPTNAEIAAAVEAAKAGETGEAVKYLPTGETGNYNLPNRDAGFVEYNRSITGKAWFDNGKDDKNHDGSLDGENDDQGIEDITVKLLVKDETGEYVPVKDAEGNEVTTTTDENGDYAFNNLPEGTYKVVFENPKNQELTDKEAEGVESAKNSKAEQVTEDGKIRGEIEEIKLPGDKEIKKYIDEKSETDPDASYDEKTGTFTRGNQNVGYFETPEEPETPDTPESESDKTPESESDKTPESESDKTPESESDKTPESESDKTPESESDKTPESESDKTPESESDKTPESESDKTPESESDKTPESESDKTPESESDKTPESESDKTPESESDKTPESESDKTPESESDKTPETESEKQTETESEKQTETESEKQTETESETQTEIESETQTETESEEQTETESETQTETESETNDSKNGNKAANDRDDDGDTNSSDDNNGSGKNGHSNSGSNGSTSQNGSNGAVKTGDTTNLVFPTVTLLLAAAAIISLLALRRRRRVQ